MFVYERRNERETNLGDDNVRNIFEMLSEVFIEHENETEDNFGLIENLHEVNQISMRRRGKTRKIETHST